ncbi:MAG: dihydroneopterin aldolase [Succinivibrio sp.]
MDRVFVKNLKVDCVIGILPEERVKTQPLLVSLDLYLDLKEAGYTGDLTKSADYALLSAKVKEYIIERRAELLEELGVELCDLILKEFNVEKVVITLNKPMAVPGAEASGIQISKQKNNGDKNGN